MTFVEDLGRVGGKTVGGHLLVGYDDVKSVQYFKQNLDPYWKKKFPTIELAFADAEKNYAKTMKICDRWDEQVRKMPAGQEDSNMLKFVPLLTGSR